MMKIEEVINNESGIINKKFIILNSKKYIGDIRIKTYLKSIQKQNLNDNDDSEDAEMEECLDEF